MHARPPSRIVLPLCGLLVLLLAAWLVSAGWLHGWSSLGLPALWPAFSDLRTVQGALISMASGLDPYIDNPGDPWRRQLNYPAIWIWLAKTGGWQDESHFLVFCGLSLVAFLLACLALLRSAPSWPLLLGCFSSAACLLVERGNSDQLMFALAVGLAATPVLWQVLLIALGTCLKVYPVFWSLLLLGPGARWWHRLVLAVLLFTCLAYLFADGEMARIRAATPVDTAGHAYGLAIWRAHLSSYPLFSSRASFLALCGGLLLAVAAVRHWLLPQVKCLLSHGKALHDRWFLLGASVYVGSFWVGANYDYRMVFLLMCMPACWSAGRLPQALVVLMLVSMNSFFLSWWLVAPAKGLVLVLLSAVLAERVRQDVARWVSPKVYPPSPHAL
jgi:hypothetical protein